MEAKNTHNHSEVADKDITTISVQEKEKPKKRRGRPPKNPVSANSETNVILNSPTSEKSVEEKPKKRRGRPPKKESEKIIKGTTKSPFTENALFCDNFDPETIVQISSVMYEPLLHNEQECFAITENCAFSIFVPKLYINSDGYRKWFRHVFPKGGIVEEKIENIHLFGSADDGEHHNEESYVPPEKGLTRHTYVQYKVTVNRGLDYMPVTAIGLSAVNSFGKGKSFANYSNAEALAKALKSIGFGEGLNWEYLQLKLPTYISLDGNGFIKYDGPVMLSSGQIIKEGNITAEEFFEKNLNSKVRKEINGCMIKNDEEVEAVIETNILDSSKTRTMQNNSSLALIENYNAQFE